jgi:hypothetical protein
VGWERPRTSLHPMRETNRTSRRTPAFRWTSRLTQHYSFIIPSTGVEGTKSYQPHSARSYSGLRMMIDSAKAGATTVSKNV